MIKILNKAMGVMNLLNKHKELGVTEIGQIMGEDKSTIYRILHTLEKYELVTKNEKTKKYKLGFGLLKYCANISAESDLTKIARPFLEELKNNTSESSHICVLTKNNSALFLDNINQDAVLNINTQIGTEQPLHCAAVAKSIIANLPEEKISEIVDTIEYTPFTVRTITSKETYLEHLEKVRKQGFSMDDEEIYTGVRCVAAPIKNSKGEVFASIGVSGPATRIQLANLEFYVDSVKTAAKKISNQYKMLGK